MKTESIKTFKHGFVLSEEELRRIVDSMDQHIKQASGAMDPIHKFELKFRNGALSTTDSLDEILELENIGSGELIRLKIKIQDNDDKPENEITLEFINSKEERQDELISVKYTIIGTDRNWVFVTSSELEERLSRIKRFNFTRLGTFEIVLLAFPIIFFIFLFATVIPIMSNAIQENKNQLHMIEDIENQYLNGQISDPVEVFIALEKNRISANDFPPDLFISISLFIGIPFLIFLLFFSTGYLYPPYNFYWGEYIKVLDRKNNLARFILIGIILAIIISVVANYISRLIGIGS